MQENVGQRGRASVRETEREMEYLDRLRPERVRVAGKIAGLGSLFATVRTHDAGDDGEWVDKAGADVYVPKRLLEHVGRSERTPLAVGQRVLVSARRPQGRKEAGVDLGRYKWVATALELAPRDAEEDLGLHGSKVGVGLSPTERGEGGGGGREAAEGGSHAPRLEDEEKDEEKDEDEGSSDSEVPLVPLVP